MFKRIYEDIKQEYQMDKFTTFIYACMVYTVVVMNRE